MKRKRPEFVDPHVPRRIRMIDGVPHITVADAFRGLAESESSDDDEADDGAGEYVLHDIGERRVRTRERGSVVRPKAATRTRPRTR